MAAQGKLEGVQYLRAVAALMVAYLHVSLWVPSYTPYLGGASWIDTRYFAGAVPVFFVISGFVMYISALESRPGRFIGRRLARIVPIYWLATLVMVVIASRHGGVAFVQVVKSLLFIPYWDHPGEIAYPVLNPGWSLNYEIFFYALFALALFLPVRWRLPGLLAVLLCLVAAGRVFPGLGLDAIGATYTSRLLILFGAGAALGWAYRRGALGMPPSLALALSVGGLVALVAVATPAPVRDMIAPVVVVLGVVALDFSGATPRWDFAGRLGDASYSLYLVHYPVFDAVWKYWLRLHVHGRYAAVGFALVAMVVAVGMALLCFRFVERPCMRWFSRSRGVLQPVAQPAT